MVKTFGEFEFDDRRKVLTAEGRSIRLSGQTVELLCLLLERPGELIMREEIRRRLWPESHVEFEHSLDVVMSRLRSTLAEKSGNPRYIETVPRKGYRFIEPVAMKSEGSPRQRASQMGSPFGKVCGYRDSGRYSRHPHCTQPIRQIRSTPAFANADDASDSALVSEPPHAR